MKKLITSSIILCCMVMAISSCKKSNDNSSFPSVSPIVTNGTWRVSFYYDKIKDETSDLASYTFTFQSNGQFVANSSSGTTNGTWSEKNDDSKGGSHKLIISIGSSSPLSNLTNSWLVTSQTSTKIELKDDSNNNEILHFSKN